MNRSDGRQATGKREREAVEGVWLVLSEEALAQGRGAREIAEMKLVQESHIVCLLDPIQEYVSDWSSALSGTRPSDFRMAQQIAVARCTSLSQSLSVVDSVRARRRYGGASKVSGGGSADVGVDDVEATMAERMELVAWHVIAGRMDELILEWSRAGTEEKVGAVARKGEVSGGRSGSRVPRLRDKLEQLQVEIKRALGYFVRFQPPQLANPPFSAVSPQFQERKVGFCALGDVYMQAVCVFPAAFHLHEALEREVCGLFSKEGKEFVAAAWTGERSGSAPVRWRIPFRGSSGRFVDVWVCGADGLLAVQSDRKLRQGVSAVVGASRFRQGETEREVWERELPWFREPAEVPVFDVTRVMARKAVWDERLGNFMTMAARTVVGGRFTVPLIDYVEPFEVPNHKTLEQDEEMVERIIIKYLYTGALELCPAGWTPKCVSALGLVPKNDVDEPWRLIHDCRPVNRHIHAWPTSMKSMGSSAHLLLTPKCFTFQRDISSAYHNAVFLGCGRGLVPDGTRHDGSVRFRNGCVAGVNCTNECDKSHFGIQFRNRWFRFCAAPFGMRISNQGLAALLEPVLRKFRARGCRVLCWVDDILFAVRNRCTTDEGCGGVERCADCRNAHDTAVTLAEVVDEELGALGFLTNSKDTPVSQANTFLGLSYDTVRGVMFVDQSKAGELQDKFQECVTAGRTTRRNVAKLKGKLMWWAPCLSPQTRLLTRAMNRFVGSPTSVAEWDEELPVEGSVGEELEFWASSLVSVCKDARPIWSVPPSRLRELHEQGGQSPISQTLTCDASWYGWGATLEVGGQKFEAHGTYPAELGFPDAEQDAATKDFQAQRELAGTLLAVKAFREKLAGNVVLHCTDCSPAMAASVKGSSKVAMQKLAKELWKVTIAAGIDLISCWIPGNEMLVNGVDALSRIRESGVHSLSVTDETWKLACDIATQLFGCAFTVDMFAANGNQRCERFWSERFSVGAEQVDALAVPSWEVRSGGCGCEHSGCREVLWAFPPTPLLPLFWSRAQTDGARGVCLVPFNSNSVWWPVAMDGASNLHASVHRLPPGDVSLQLPATNRAALSNSRDDTRRNCAWSLVPFDFSRTRVLNSQPVCAQAAEVREALDAQAVARKSLEEQRRQLMWFAASLAMEDRPSEGKDDGVGPRKN